jgi:hypothetical protein
MGGRRSRYWCGPGIFRETKKAAGRRFTGHWGAPTLFDNEGKLNAKKRGREYIRPQNGFFRKYDERHLFSVS